MARRWDSWKARLRRWRDALAGDLRSIVVSSLCTWLWGVLFLAISTQFASTRPKEFTNLVDENGFGKPLPILVRLLERDPVVTKVTFVPANVEQAYVCEFARLKAETARELLLNYVDRYRACFDVRQISEQAVVISSNVRSGEMTELNGSWLCKCASALAN